MSIVRVFSGARSWIRTAVTHDRALLVAAFVAFGASFALALSDQAIGAAAGGILALGFGGTAWWLVEQRRRAASAEVERYARLATRRADQVSILSHEIRTPLAIIKGSAELLAEETPGPLNDRQRTFVRRVADKAGEVIDLSEDLLAHARIEAGIFELHLERVNLRSLLRQTVRELRQVLDADLAFDSFEAPIRLLADPALIKQVVVNLVTNAVRSSGRRPRVTVRLMRRDRDVLVSVSDSGRGMTEQQRERLFHRFASDVAGGGTGLGLYVSQHIVNLHGGRIFVDTIAQHGTTMMFTLPMRKDDEEDGDEG